MRCAAEGRPKPNVEWRKYDGSTIPVGSWKGRFLFYKCLRSIQLSIFCFFFIPAISVPGHTLNITRINRQHMGVYMCIADNGIPPPANQTFVLEVYCKSLFKNNL